MTATWTWQELVGYLSTWSAVQRFRQERNYDPVEHLSKRLRRAWGTATHRKVHWPVALRVGRVE